jgi:uncharacterized protein YkwD
MASDNSLAHNPRLGSSVHGWHYLAENVGVGPTLASLKDAFYASAPHRANMLDPRYTMVGVGAVPVAGKIWVVEDFEASWSAPATHKKSAPRASASTSVRTASTSRPAKTQRHPAVAKPKAPAALTPAACQAQRFFAMRRQLKYTWTGPRHGPARSTSCSPVSGPVTGKGGPSV